MGTALRLLAIDPLQESVHRTLMRLYAALDRRGDALRQYRECVAVLQRELAAEPEVEGPDSSTRRSCATGSPGRLRPTVARLRPVQSPDLGPILRH